MAAGGWAAAARGVKGLLLSSMGATCTWVWHSDFCGSWPNLTYWIWLFKKKKKKNMDPWHDWKKVNVTEAKHSRTAVVSLDSPKQGTVRDIENMNKQSSSKRHSPNFSFTAGYERTETRKESRFIIWERKTCSPKGCNHTQHTAGQPYGTRTHWDHVTEREMLQVLTDLSWSRGKLPTGNPHSQEAGV